MAFKLPDIIMERAMKKLSESWSYLTGKIILITGGTGSFGMKFVDIVLRESRAKTLRIFSRGELKQQEMRLQFNNNNRLRFFIGDVRDRDRLHRAMNKVDVVIHAAALKQVPTCEYNPIEAVKTNIDGAVNVIDATIDNGVEKVMALSTDKAVYPVNLYGATKLVAEKLFIQANSYACRNGTMMSCIRYGNVIGSRGSVIPIFKEQQRKGFISITDKKMTRFWITQEQAVRFIITCIGKMSGGEIFIPKIPSMKIIDLAKVIAPNVKCRETGIRPGEKINEILLTKEETGHTREFENCFVIEPEHSFWVAKDLMEGRALPEGFQYSSEKNEHWLTQDNLQAILKDLE